jgi:hypothetical protein
LVALLSAAKVELYMPNVRTPNVLLSLRKFYGCYRSSGSVVALPEMVTALLATAKVELYMPKVSMGNIHKIIHNNC